jgi:hypothetical protein
MKKTILLLLLGFSSIGCETGTSVSFKKDLLNNVTTKGNGLSCEKVEVLVDGESPKSNEIIYGQKLEFKFKDTEGFKLQKGLAHPGLRMSVFNKKGDTLVNYADLYDEYNDKGIDINRYNLFAELIIATPILSGQVYQLEIFIWDKKGKGTFKMNYDFSLITDPKIGIKLGGLTAKEMYLFDNEEHKVITNHVIAKNKEITLFLKGIEGFVVENEAVFPGFTAKIIDANNLIALNNKDLFEKYTTEGVPVSIFDKQMYLDFDVYGKDLKGPVTIKCKMWDKKSDKFLELEMKCDVKE